MKRLLAPLLALLGLAFLSSPASAYCVRNDTTIPLSVVLKTYSPLGDFREIVAPGRKVCCDWFDRRCNPVGTREAVVSLSVRNVEIGGLPVDEGGSNITRFGDNKLIIDQTQSADRFDRYGRPHAYGRYDRYGRDTRYDRYGRFDAERPQEYHREKVEKLREELAASAQKTPLTKKPKDRFCVRGRQPVVLAAGAGTVTVSEDTLKAGGLRCESRDHFLRPVSPPSQASEFGVPIPELPVLTPAQRKRRSQSLTVK